MDERIHMLLLLVGKINILFHWKSIIFLPINAWFFSRLFYYLRHPSSRQRCEQIIKKRHYWTVWSRHFNRYIITSSSQSGEREKKRRDDYFPHLKLTSSNQISSFSVTINTTHLTWIAFDFPAHRKHRRLHHQRAVIQTRIFPTTSTNARLKVTSHHPQQHHEYPLNQSPQFMRRPTTIHPTRG